MNIYEVLIEKLEKAKAFATFETSSFGFPNDRIEIKSVHFGGDRTGHEGDVLHPDKYIRQITDLYRRSWIISPIDDAINILRVHAETIRASEKLIASLEELNIPALIEKAKAGLSA